MIRRICIGVFVLVSIYAHVSAQKFGIRAGLNYNRFSGPLEQGLSEKFQYSNGFHFGVNYLYKLTDVFSVSGEVGYSQGGTQHQVFGDGYYKIPITSPTDFVNFNAFSYEKGYMEYNIKVSNAYIQIPISLHIKPNTKIPVLRNLELTGGAYLGFLIGPRGNGTLYFDQNNDRVRLKQTLIHNYNSDRAKGMNVNGGPGPGVFLGEQIVLLAKETGAYYNYLESEMNGRLYRAFDLGLTGGLNYYFNKGFYLGCRYELGLLDVNNNKMDMLKGSYDEENLQMIPSNHFDRNTGIQISLGFRF